VPAADLGYMAAYQAGQLLGLVILAALAFWLLRRARRRSEKRYEELAPEPPTVSEIVAAAEPVAESNGTPPEEAEPHEEAELREIYEKVGKPEAFAEAKEKVVDLAAQLVEREGLDMDEALRTAYRRSLAEHREYLAAKGLA
jgi:hypothetical protein